jgi:octaheme c-type cytochrome (tetrathionate reductase family)
MAQQATKTQTLWTTTDHSKHKALQKTFSSGQEITQACLSCHSEAEQQFKQTIHWTWVGHTDENGKQLGKAGDSLNNFCLSTNRMEDKGCSACHTGWQAKSQGVNCLACHSSKKVSWSEAFEDYTAFSESDDPEELDIAREIQTEIQTAAQSIGRPTRQNCGECHFNGGGGDGVKHGDLDTSLAKPNKALDVHMGVDGQNFDCVRCHTTTLHNIAGRTYSTPALHRAQEPDRRRPGLQDHVRILPQQHTPRNRGIKANDHTDKVACQSCHIPEFARVNCPPRCPGTGPRPANSRAVSRLPKRAPYGKASTIPRRAISEMGKMLAPYFWFNGSMNAITAKDTIDPSQVVDIVTGPVGSPATTPTRASFPFKVHEGRQPYDKINKNLLIPKLFGPKGSGAYWAEYDWKKALENGMQAAGLTFSGEFDFVDTRYVFPITHMVAPKENVVACIECHSPEGRLASLGGFYMPGRDSFKTINIIGWVLVSGHSGGRQPSRTGAAISRRRKED